MPERQTGGTTGRRLHDNAIGADFLNAPGAGAKGDDIAHPRLHHHLLIQLAHPAPPLLRVALGQHHREHAAVGNGARRSDCQALGAGPRLQEARFAIPQDARGELGHLPQAGPAAVAQGLDGGAGEEKVVILRCQILLEDLLEEVRIVHGTVLRHLVQLAGLAGQNGTLGAGEHGDSSFLTDCSGRRRGRSRRGRRRGRPG